MPIAVYILIQTEVGKVRKVAEEVKKIKLVKMVHAVSGEYDVIAYLETLSLQDLGDIITEIHKIDGVRRTQTCIELV